MPCFDHAASGNHGIFMLGAGSIWKMRANALFPVGVYEQYPFAYRRVGSSHGGEF